MKGWLLAVLCVVAAACGDRDDRLTEWDGVTGPYVVGDRVAYVDDNFNELLVFTAEVNNPSPPVTRLPVQPGSTVVGTVDAKQALVMTADAEQLLQVAYPDNRVLEEFEINGPYDRFAFSQDPPLVAAYYSDNPAGGEETLVLNKGEIFVLDLSGKKAASSTRTLQTYGGSPLGVEFAPPVDLGGKTRQLVFVRWESFVSIFDLGDTSLKPIAVRLKAPDSEASVYPGKLQFVAEGGKVRGFFIAAGTLDLYMVEVDVPNLGVGENKGVLINIFPTAAGASRFETYTAVDGKTAVLVACGAARKVALVRPDSSEVILYQVDINAYDMRLFRVPGTDEQAAFIYDNNGYENRYYFVELDRLDEKKSKAFHLYSLQSGINRVYLLGDRERFLVFHQPGSADPLSLVAAADGSVYSLGVGPTLSQEVFSADGNRMFALAQKGGVTELASFDFSNPQQILTEKVNVTHAAAPTMFRFLEEEEMVIAADSEGRTLLVAPSSFEEESDVVELFAPYLFGLEH